MSNPLKYIRFNELNGFSQVILIFPSFIGHDVYLKMLNQKLENVVSAGFCSLHVTKNGNPAFSCFGRSVSLKKESLPDDSYFLNSQHYDFFDMENL